MSHSILPATQRTEAARPRWGGLLCVLCLMLITGGAIVYAVGAPKELVAAAAAAVDHGSFANAVATGVAAAQGVAGRLRDSGAWADGFAAVSPAPVGVAVCALLSLWLLLPHRFLRPTFGVLFAVAACCMAVSIAAPPTVTPNPNCDRVHDATVRRMVVRSGDFIDFIEYWNAAGHSHKEGGIGGVNSKEITLGERECFVRLERWQGGMDGVVHAMRLVTNLGRGFGRFGGDFGQGTYRNFVAPAGECLIGIGMRQKVFPDKRKFLEHVEPIWG